MTRATSWKPFGRGASYREGCLTPPYISSG